MKIEIENLMTIKNYADSHDVTPSYIYKLIRNSIMDCIVIDSVQFIDTKRFPSIPVANRRK